MKKLLMQESDPLFFIGSFIFLHKTLIQKFFIKKLKAEENLLNSHQLKKQFYIVKRACFLREQQKLFSIFQNQKSGEHCKQ